MKVFICTNDNQSIAAKVSRNTILKRSKYKEMDVIILEEADVSELKFFHSKPYLRGGRMIEPDKKDMQSFTLLRFYVPELMGFSGKALVIDPDIFLIRNGLEELEDFDFESSSIFARKGLRRNSWGSSVLLLDCEKLEHWSLRSFIDGLHNGTIDYDDLMSLKHERSVMPMESKWNEFDEINTDTLLLHTTERITQPWRAGLKLNSSIKPILKFIPREPVYKLFGKDLSVGREHPKPEVSEFFFKELSECIEKKVISIGEIEEGIDKNFLRKDLKEKLSVEFW